MTRTAVVGCSNCSELWLVETTKQRDRQCPRCGRTYRADSRPRRRLSTHETQRAARVARSRRLADRCTGNTDLELDAGTDPHTVEVGNRPFYADAFADEVSDKPFYADVFAEEVSDKPFYADAFAEDVSDKPFYVRCKRAGVARSPPADDRDTLTREIIDQVAKSPGGVPVRSLADSIYAPDATDTEYQRVWRAVKACEEGGKVETARLGRCREVFLADDGVLDTASGITVASTSRSSTAAHNARVFLNARDAVTTAEEAGDMIGTLAGKLLGEQRGPNGGERTRFNDMNRALGGVDRIREAFAGATATGRTRGVLVSATTHMARFETLADAVEGFMDDVGALRQKCGSPPGITVVEPTELGSPHAHVLLFANPDEIPTEHDLHDYWHECRGRGFQVDVTPFERDPTVPLDADPVDAWRWMGDRPEDASEGCSPMAYLEQGPRALAATATLTAEEVFEVAQAFRAHGDQLHDAEMAAAVDAAVRAETGVDARSVRRAAWYFATGLKTVTRPSPSLRETTPNGSFPKEASVPESDVFPVSTPDHTGSPRTRVRCPSTAVVMRSLGRHADYDRPPPQTPILAESTEKLALLKYSEPDRISVLNTELESEKCGGSGCITASSKLRFDEA